MVIGGAGGGTVSAGSLVRDVVTGELGGILAGNGEKLVAVGALWDLDVVLVGPGLDL